MGVGVLKKRIIPLLLLKNGRLVKSIQFANYRDVGDPISSASVYDSQQADELIILNIEGAAKLPALIALANKMTRQVFMPVAFGGGIQNEQEAISLIQNGADKIVLNSICYESPHLISSIANHFGSQAVIVAIDVRFVAGEWQLFSHQGEQRQNISLHKHILRCIQYGAGEILLQSIDNDGEMNGFSLQLVEEISSIVRVPIILAGGSGNYEHLLHAFQQTDISAVACGSLFNFTDSNPMRANAYLRNHHLPFKKI